MDWELISTGPEETETLGEVLGSLIKAPQVIELRSDLGGGKTTFMRGLVRGMGSNDKVSSPTFTINKIYKAQGRQIHHFDFYRLNEPGLVRDQLQESLKDSDVVTVIEWANSVADVLPKNRIIVEFKPVPHNEDERIVTFIAPSDKVNAIEQLRNKFTKTKP